MNPFEAYVHKVKNDWNEQAKHSKRIELWPENKMPEKMEANEFIPALLPFLSNIAAPKGAVIVCAGGSYQWKEPQEAFPHVTWLNEQGYHAFVLDYRVFPYHQLQSLQDLQRAIRHVRYYKNKYILEEKPILLMGFSAGGHLSLMAAEQFDKEKLTIDEIDTLSDRPDGVILGYPGISFSDFDADFLIRIFGIENTKEMVKKAELHNNIRGNMPPIFLWGNKQDFLYDSWIQFIEKARDKQLALEALIFEYGRHAEGREPSHPLYLEWTQAVKSWLDNNWFNK